MKKHRLSFFIFVFITASALMAFRRHAPASNQPQSAEKVASGENPSFLFLSDIHLNTQSKTTTYGGDTGMDLWAAFLKKVERLLAAPHSPKFIIYTGDLPAHYNCNGGSCYLPPYQRAAHNANITVVLNALQNMAIKYHKSIFYLPGNNDALAGDYYSFADQQQHTPLWLVSISGNFFPSGNTRQAKVPCMISNPNPAMGYYSAYPIQGLRLIALNTVIYDPAFSPVDGTTQLNDGNTQMAWLAGQLADAEAKGEKVYIAMHVPPGLDAYSNKSMWVPLPKSGTTWEDQFLNLAARYKTIIEGILYGHTHMDEVRRLYDSAGNITEVAISCPGVTPQHYNNPGFKIVQYNATNMALMDFTTFFTSPGKTAWGDSTYIFSKVYGSATGTSLYQQLSTMPFDTLANRMSNTYTVHNGPAGYNIATGIDVKAGQ